MKRKDSGELPTTLLAKTMMDPYSDLSIWEVAAMVYVGDIYALIAVQGTDETAAPAGEPTNSVWPFIR